MKRFAALLVVFLALASWTWALGPPGPIDHVPQAASSTTAGVIEIATNAETAAATRTDVATTPGNTYGEFSGSTIADNSTIPGIAQALETAVELRAVTTAPGTMGGTTSFIAYTKPPITISAGNLNATAAMVANGYIEITQAGEVELPAGTLGMNGSIRASGAFQVCVDPYGSEVMELNGVAQAAGTKVCSTSTANDSITILHNGTNWIIWGPSTWTNGGA